VLLDMVARSVGFAVVLGVLLFLPAGTLAWPQAWVFIVLFGGWGLGLGVWLMKADPGLLASRMKSPLSAEQKASDRAVMTAILIAFLGWFVLMALDARRFSWSATPFWAQILGAVLISAAYLGWIGVLKANSFASVTIGLQQERRQAVISSGPYALVRHPMYSYSLLLMLGAPLLLGSLWGLLGLVLFVPLLAARIAGEEALLREGLAGYREYVGKVRFRLVPGVW
jgi:protein-S-isoprenylcysteine O-methyltransferase Ste14